MKFRSIRLLAFVFSRNGLWCAAVLMHLATWGMVLECLEHTDIGMGITAPPVLIATVGVALLGLLATVAWIVLLLRAWLGRRETIRKLRALVQAVVVGGLAWVSGWIMFLGSVQLVGQGPKVEKMLQQERVEELATIRRNRVAELARQGPGAITALVEVLNDEDQEVRLAAARALGEMGPQALAALSVLEKRLKLNAATVSLEASICLLAMQKIAPQSALDYLTAALHETDPRIRIQAVRGFCLLKREAKTVVPKTVVPVLVTALEEPDAEVRREAAEVLGEVGPQARAGLPALKKQLKRKAATASLEASTCLLAMYKIAPQSAFDYLHAALHEADPRIRIQAAHDFWWLKKDAKTVVPILIAALGEPDAEVRRAAAQQLGEIGPAAKEAIPALLKAAEDPDRSIQMESYTALRQIQTEPGNPK